MFTQWLSRVASTSQAFLAEVRRAGWVLFLAALALLFISQSGRELLAQQLGVLAWKVMLVGTAVLIAHVARSQMFPYLHLGQMLQEGHPNSGRLFLGICILTSAIILAICSGL